MKSLVNQEKDLHKKIEDVKEKINELKKDN